MVEHNVHHIQHYGLWVNTVYNWFYLKPQTDASKHIQVDTVGWDLQGCAQTGLKPGVTELHFSIKPALVQKWPNTPDTVFSSFNPIGKFFMKCSIQDRLHRVNTSKVQYLTQRIRQIILWVIFSTLQPSMINTVPVQSSSLTVWRLSILIRL